MVFAMSFRHLEDSKTGTGPQSKEEDVTQRLTRKVKNWAKELSGVKLGHGPLGRGIQRVPSQQRHLQKMGASTFLRSSIERFLHDAKDEAAAVHDRS